MSNLTIQQINLVLGIVNGHKRVKAKGTITNWLSSNLGVGIPNSNGNTYRYSHKDVQVLKQLLNNHGIDPDNPPKTQDSRTLTGGKSVNEKLSNGSVFSEPIAVKVLKPGCQLNGRDIYPTGKGHIQLDAKDINHIGANAIVLVENLDTFKQLDKTLLKNSNHNVIYIWRGGISGISKTESSRYVKTISIPNTEKLACELSKKFKLSLGYFGDLDLSGLAIASRLPVKFLILPDLEELKGVKGNRELFQKQQGVNPHNWPDEFREGVSCYIEELSMKKEAFTQERTSALDITHVTIEIDS